MNLHFRPAWLGLSLCAVALVGCDDANPSTGNGQVFSSMSELERSSFREVMRHFHSETVDGLNLKFVAPLIVAEGLRFFPHAAAADDYRVEGYAFSLLDALPENDYWGDWANSGGYAVFMEDGDEVHKKSAYFSSGDVENYAYADTEGTSTGPLETRKRNAEAFEISADATYNEDRWHQTVKRSYASDEDDEDFLYSYASHPQLAMTLTTGSSYSKEEVMVDTISSSSGWTSVTDRAERWALAGTVTRYRPSDTNASRNTASEVDDFSDEQVSGGIRTVSSLATTVSDSETSVGERSEVTENRELRSSERGTYRYNGSIPECTATCIGSKGANVADDCPGCENLDEEALEFPCINACEDSLFRACVEGCEGSSGGSMPYACNGCDLSDEATLSTYCNRSCQGPSSDFNTGHLVSSSAESHATETVTYELRSGYGYDAVIARGLEFVQDYVVTTRTLVDVTVSGAEVVTVTTRYRYTDNRANRNDIASWKSTRNEARRTYRLEEDEDGFITFEWDAVDEGVEWLTSELETDPAFAATPYAYSADLYEHEDDSTTYFGDDESASDTLTEVVTERTEEVTWNEVMASVSGGHTVISGGIDNGDGVSHEVAANADGSYDVSLGEVSVTVGAEEWLDSVAP
jgi:hypothetical protein